MRLYLVQHGAARPESEDPQRSLTEEGRRTVERVAAWFSRLGAQPHRIEHSTKLRARQTAEIFASKLGATTPLVQCEGLAPNDPVEPVAERLAGERADLMIVGHLPFLSRLASKLLGVDPEHTLIRFHMGGVVCLEKDEQNRWQLVWAVPPELVP